MKPINRLNQSLKRQSLNEGTISLGMLDTVQGTATQNFILHETASIKKRKQHSHQKPAPEIYNNPALNSVE